MTTDKGALLHAVSAYVPHLVVQRVVDDPSAELVGWEERQNAVVLFADVSGFTAMSESLARLGKEGAEELTQVLNTYFSAMVDLVHAYGGAIIKFGGDAITCRFMDDITGLRNACACALAMQEKMAEFQEVSTRGGIFTLRMKIGISGGLVLSLSVGDPQQGLEYVLAGRPLDRMAEAEHHAQAGEVVLDCGCVSDAAQCYPWLEWHEIHDGFWRVEGLTQTVVPTSAQTRFDWDRLDDQAIEKVSAHLVPYLPPTVYARILDGQRQFVGEHRWVVSLFVNFMGLDYDNDSESGLRLQRYFTAMQTVIVKYGGRLNRVITGDKGSLLHLIFGAPVTHEDNEERAVSCALDMQNLVLHSGEYPFIVDQRIGIASGYVFAGDVGSDRRREYTVMGDVVNLSARLMQAAQESQILMGRQTMRRVESQFVCEALPPVKVKGKQEPVAIFRPVSVRKMPQLWSVDHARGKRRVMVGRDKELSQVREIIEDVLSDHGQLLVISGEAGVGKSRLLEAIVSLAQNYGMYGSRGDCLSYGSQTPYLPWIDFFNAFFGLNTRADETSEQKIYKITQRMRAVDPALEDWVPLMGQLLGLPVADNALTGALDAQLHKQRTFEIALSLLRHQAQQVPLFLMVFEDVHWIDAISLEMLNYVARNIAGYRILLVALHRPTIELTEWQRYDNCHWITLSDLSPEDALSLMRYKLGMDEVPAVLRERVVQGEARVNPFFVEEVINALIDQGYLIEIPGETENEYILSGDLSEVEIPDSVQALVMSRIDRLDEGSKLAVKVASVIGRTFRYRALSAIYPVEVSSDRLLGNLEKLNRLDLTPLDKPAPDWEYIFKHVTTQEVAYESLLYRHRRELHQSFGEYLERTYADSLEEYYELLAHHYYQSGNQDKSWQYLLKAGDKARARYANEAAITYYTQALSVRSDSDEVAQVHDALGDVYQLIGQYERARDNYHQALDIEIDDIGEASLRVAQIRRKLAMTWGVQGQYEKALHYLYLTRDTLGEDQETPEMAGIYSDIGWIAVRQGDYERALDSCKRGLRISEVLSMDEECQRVRAELQNTLGSVYVRVGEYTQAIQSFEESLETREQIGDLYGLGRAYNNLAAVYWGLSEYGRASQYFQQSLEIFQRIGYARGMAMGYNNLGGVYYALGDYARAIAQYESSLALRQEIGDLKGIADVYNNLGEVHQGLGNHKQARYYLQEAVRLFMEIGDKRTLSDAYKLLAEVDLASERIHEALDYCQQSLALAREIGDHEYEGRAYRVLGQIYRRSGMQKQSVDILLGSIDTLKATGNKLELGRSIYELGLTLLPSDPEAARARLAKAVDIFESLGVEGDLEKAQAALHRAT